MADFEIRQELAGPLSPFCSPRSAFGSQRELGQGHERQDHAVTLDDVEILVYEKWPLKIMEMTFVSTTTAVIRAQDATACPVGTRVRVRGIHRRQRDRLP